MQAELQPSMSNTTQQQSDEAQPNPIPELNELLRNAIAAMHSKFQEAQTSIIALHMTLENMESKMSARINPPSPSADPKLPPTKLLVSSHLLAISEMAIFPLSQRLPYLLSSLTLHSMSHLGSSGPHHPHPQTGNC